MSERPNIVFLFPDQLRSDFLSCYGATFIDTPHIDSLGACGVQYQNAYSASPVCVPARVCLLTGMNAIKNGVLDNAHFLPPHYHQSGVRTWPEMLGEAGYYTAAIGKMHFHPWDAMMGFHRRIIAEDKIWIHIRDDYAEALAEHGYRKTVGLEKPEYHANHGAFVSDIPWDLTVDRWVGQQTCRFIREYDRDGPFAVMVGFPGPHNPYDPAPEFARLFDPECMPAPIPLADEAQRLGVGGTMTRQGGSASWYAIENDEFTEAHKRIMRVHYAALVKQIDHEVGCILAALRERGLLENTVILLSSDHGDYLGDHDLTGKNSFYEPAAHIPLLVRLPRAEGGRRVEGLVELADITASILRLAHIALPSYMDARPLPGVDAVDGAARPHITGMLATGWMMLDGAWKLCKYSDGQTMCFHLPSDPHEARNLYGEPQHAPTVRRLDSALTREIAHAVQASSYERRVMAGSLSHSDDFGRRGWPRPYPGQAEP